MVVIVFVREFVLECVGSPEPVAHPVPVEAAVAAALAIRVADTVMETDQSVLLLQNLETVQCSHNLCKQDILL